MQINTNYKSPVNTSYMAGRKIEYIVLHYTAGTQAKSGTGASVCRFWSSGAVKASADFVVDVGGVYQYNPDIASRYTWAVGGNKYATSGGSLYGVVKNSNSISIEMCSENSTGKVQDPCDKGWSIPTAVRDQAVELVRHLMDKYGIPVDRVVRHYDVTGKPCPGVQGWCEYGNSTNSNEWGRFKGKLFKATETKAEEHEMTLSEFVDNLTEEQAATILAKARSYYKKQAVAEWATTSWAKATESGLTDGTRPADLVTRQEVAVMIDRLSQ